jgi:hypothetical protein
MKRTSNPLTIFTVIAIVAIIACGIIALAEQIFGVAPVFIVAICAIPVVFGWIVWTDHKVKLERQRAFDEKYLSNEAFRHKVARRLSNERCWAIFYKPPIA